LSQNLKVTRRADSDEAVTSTLTPTHINDSPAWREALLDKFRYAIILGMLFASVTVLLSARSGALRWQGFTILVLLPAIHWLLSNRKLSFVGRSWTAIGTMATVSVIAYVLVGLNPGPPLLAGLSLVAATLLLGRRQATLLLAIYVLMLAFVTTAIWSGLWDGPPPAESNGNDALIWLRTSILSVILWTTTAYGVFFVVNTVEKTLQQREKALQQLREEVAQREAAEQAQREAEALALQSQKLESLGHLAAGVAHDFNNALLVVQGWNDILRHSNTPENRSKGADAIEQATEQAGQLARQLLTFARQEVRSPRYLLADKVISDTVGTLSPLLPPAYRVVQKTEAGAAFYADAAQVQQLLFNLIINARDAMPEGGDIVVQCRRIASDDIPERFPDVDTSDEWIAIVVRDYGHGVDDDIRDRIFEPFFTTKEVGKGTGLGLSTAFGIVRQSGGHISLRTQRGRGSTFTVYFPAVQVAPHEIATPELVGTSGSAVMRVLVLEDDKLARELISYALRREQIPIEVVKDGDEALEALRKGHGTFDTLCTDAVFPGAPLHEVIEAFRSASPGGRVLICSGYVRESLTIEGLESGDFEFMAKPFTASELVRKIRGLGR